MAISKLSFSPSFMWPRLLSFQRLSYSCEEISEKGSLPIVFLQQIQLLPSTSRNIENTANLIILLITLAAAAILPLLPYEKIQGNWVPTFISRHEAWKFPWLIVSIMLAFSGSFSSFFLHNSKPKLARFCCFCSVVFAASAIIMLVSAGY
ncbi:hypothetical protein LguiA_029699 [Lonicera macranthoides]